MMTDELVEKVAEALGNAPYPPRLHVMGEAHKRDMARAVIPLIYNQAIEDAAKVVNSPAFLDVKGPSWDVQIRALAKPT